MKPQTAKSTVLSVRCAHRDPSGRQCRLLSAGANSGLCPQHRAEQKQVGTADHFKHLTTNFQFFQTAQGINFSLMNLYQLLAQNRISPRRAAVLSYISSLLLRTLPQIDADKAAGIIDPTKPPLNVPVPHEDPGPDSDSNSKTVPDLDSDSDSHPASVNTWDPSIPEPDPKKKPS
jgi:hypothetical protein